MINSRGSAALHPWLLSGALSALRPPTKSDAVRKTENCLLFLDQLADHAIEQTDLFIAHPDAHKSHHSAPVDEHRGRNAPHTIIETVGGGAGHSDVIALAVLLPEFLQV